ncbi:hypothetical protein EDD85DRAFT_794566 [Armillaria nabsnona]|nr:hypothetical protein EDD85DRAFT_794566 [Armillaria nabsnona]
MWATATSIPFFLFLLSVLVCIRHVSPVNSFPKNGGIFYPELDDYTKEFLRVKKQEIGRDRIKDLELFPKNLLNLIENSTLEGLKHRGIDSFAVFRYTCCHSPDLLLTSILDVRWTLGLQSNSIGGYSLKATGRTILAARRMLRVEINEGRRSGGSRQKGLETLRSDSLTGRKTSRPISSTNYGQGASHIGNAPVRLEEKPDSIVSVGFLKLTSKEQPLLKFYRNNTSPYLLMQKVCAFY